MPNAAHHAPAHKIDLHNSRRVAGRVHALVRPRRRSGLRGARHTHHTQQATKSGELNHAPRATRNLPFAKLGPKLSALVSAIGAA